MVLEDEADLLQPDAAQVPAKPLVVIDYLAVQVHAAARGAKRNVLPLRALANRPRIILADEPTAALDSRRAQIVMDLLRKLALNQEAAVIAVTHDEKIFDRFDRMFMLRDGRLEDTVRVPNAA